MILYCSLAMESYLAAVAVRDADWRAGGTPPMASRLPVEPPHAGPILPPCQLQLWKAVQDGDVDAASAALADGARCATANRMGWTALHRAAMVGSGGCIALLTNHVRRLGFDARPLLHAADSAHNTALHYAAGLGHADVVSALCKAGADANRQREGDDGATPMHCCCAAIADADADAHRQEALYRTALALIAGGGLLEATDACGRLAAARLRRVQMFRLLDLVRTAQHRPVGT